LKLYNPPDEPFPEIIVPMLTPQQAPSYFQLLNKCASDKKDYKMTNINKYENLLDDPVPDIRVEVLTPQRCLLVQAVPSYFQYASDDSVKKYAKNKWNSWVNWFLDYIPFEVMKKKHFEIIQSSGRARSGDKSTGVNTSTSSFLLSIRE